MKHAPEMLLAALALSLSLVAATGRGARADGFLDEVDAGRRAVAASGAADLTDAAARAAAVQGVVAARASRSPGFGIGATLAALDADLARASARRSAGEREVVAQQVRDLLAAQHEAGIGNRALCLLSGRAQPKSLERQIRLVEPRWSCEQH